MRRLALLMFATACTEHGSGGGGGDPDKPPLPAQCEGHCISDHPVVTSTDCCDSVTCFFDEERDEWTITFCDIHPPIDPCDACNAGELCVQSYDGTCRQATACVPITAVCPENACSPACEQAYCSAPFQCQNRVPCGTESPKAFTCYGP